MKFGVLVFPGSNCDRDAAYVTRDILGHTTRMVWHQDRDISDIDVIIIPGGFSYGDYLRCGAIARFSPVMQEVVNHAEKGKFVIGICNGFQVLTEANLLPGALTRNENLHFICDRISVKVERNNLPWTSGYGDKEVITLPIAHGEGRFYADQDTLAAIEDNQQVLFRYDGENPNGSLNNIAGICNREGNVLGMMPHPERAADRSIGGTDGLRLFESLSSR
ncbi:MULTISPECIES: phosphoribosylformylglycinamidine synthase subunit PurQ [Cylindrospermopsis]|jgi:phosphoribosylformylglycinamidine synthase|uniref:phosphoribosylformylglycinamidine synthase subunit PurQ n=1 Tax=Cylindrospermopsis TaxID=77021 RepID=UPI000709B389|nr:MULTISPECIES: phosphoribosylformylglycinamidine synthase subunit PurQ [Cylindrospermopsis]KRH96442.1 phosphoribosylformylglycinamidine synthase [Cylindrospermopsis sp. CR12]MBU6344966.1 phosphoribosylformylglycinamidine synthase subunit PurQ [Cyanobacteria bacterium REEB494]TPX29271.1 phosphoribosylformylglycinamidine synthase subunit PurQ [Cylindrospermopsis raciborskii GIHE 2018]UJS04867.1 phosphoribosylformylglycinamidine synthase subunit PurQ [Cylindrospermopsis raciborskii KLL07]